MTMHMTYGVNEQEQKDYWLLQYLPNGCLYKSRSTPVAQLAPRNLLTRWDVSSIPANGIFLTKN